MWHVPNIAINPGEPFDEVVAAHRVEFIRNSNFQDDAERDVALAEFDRVAAEKAIECQGATNTVTWSLQSTDWYQP